MCISCHGALTSTAIGCLADKHEGDERLNSDIVGSVANTTTSSVVLSYIHAACPSTCLHDPATLLLASMNTLQELREHIKASGFESPASHARVSAYIESDILNHPNALFKRHVPPLDIILYAIRQVLAAPAHEVHMIPDLLDLVTTVEFYRTLALQKAREVLGENYKHPDEQRTLSREDEERLREHQVGGASLRAIYIEVVLQYCQLDIYRLWTRDPPRPADVTLRLCEYFPALNPFYAAVSPRLFHYDLSDTERADLRTRGVDCCLFVRDSCRWAAELCGPGQPIAPVLRTPAFAARFPCAVQADGLRETMEFYLGAVQAMVDELQGMLTTGVEDE
ncbi:hypothetical protein DFH07DRAFT_310148 [Mycena maculata]|uniref:Uncharacterized protein n=1 Tax=Mycena maculata TaxID=230809 RepID=A0AAD7HH00_9AGAR|nr:hypothetical protein DFH07DRAFT_310148 [Mycena maculata]